MVPQGSATTMTKELAARVVKQAKAERVSMLEAMRRFKEALARDPSTSEELVFAQLWSGKAQGSSLTTVLGAAIVGAAFGKWAARW